MDHKFTPSFTDVTKCNRCSFTEPLHADDATCEACSNTGKLNPCNGMALCRECISKEISSTLPSVPVSDLVVSEPVTNAVIQMSQQVDNSIRVSSDLFNAKTVAIVTLKQSIDADDSIPSDKKTYRLAEVLLERFNQHKKAIFDMQEKIVAEHSDQRAIQQYLNNMASQLQTEEREKLKLSDINYKPEVVKEIKPKVTKPKPQKFTNAEIKAVCAQFGVDEFMVRMTITAKQCSLLEAVHFITIAKQKANEIKTTPDSPNTTEAEGTHN